MGLVGLPRKGQKQVADLQSNPLTFLIHFVQIYNKVKYGYKGITLEVIHLFLPNLLQS